MILLLILAIAVCVIVEILTRLDLAELERVEAEAIKCRRISLERKIFFESQRRRKTDDKSKAEQEVKAALFSNRG